jgi:dihydrofolate synthase/folylpolyglutamate synthase
MEALCDTLRQLYPTRKPAIIVGILRDKNWQQMLAILRLHARRLLLVTVGSERAATAEELRQACVPDDPACPVTCHPTLADALQAARQENLVVICGSLYLVGEAMERLHIQPAPPNGHERALNEYHANPRLPSVSSPA